MGECWSISTAASLHIHLQRNNSESAVVNVRLRGDVFLSFDTPKRFKLLQKLLFEVFVFGELGNGERAIPCTNLRVDDILAFTLLVLKLAREVVLPTPRQN